MRITENYPSEIKLYDPSTGQWVTTNPWVSDVHVEPNETATLLYYALTPDIAGTYKLQTVIQYSESGTYRYYQDLYADIVVEKNTTTINGDIITALQALPVTGEDEVKVNNAIKSLQDVMSRPVATNIDINQNIHDILKAIDSLLFVTSADISGIRPMMDDLLKIWEGYSFGL